MNSRLSRVLVVIAPGMLVAATGVGAGDLATATFAGSQLGTTVLWAVLAGGLFKFVLNEGLARWQLATGTTFIEGAIKHLGSAVGYIFLPYLVLWSFFVGTALMSACGVALYAILPLMSDPADGKMVFGIAASATGLAMLRLGDFRLFERAMGVLVGLMFLTVLVTAAMVWPGAGPVFTGLFIPQIPAGGGTGLAWVVGLIGGVGGTVTILCYGYWIREKGRNRADQMGLCRLDLAAGYAMTIMFGISMVIIGSTVSLEGGGADLLVRLAESLEGSVGMFGKWVFLAGALAAVFSSLLGVWQAVPYIFADVWERLNNRSAETLATTKSYRRFQVALAVLPAAGLVVSFRQIQLLYALAGAAFIPLLACGLLILNSRKSLVGSLSNGWLSLLSLGGTLLFFLWAGLMA